jgi:nitrogen regulatory protein P-II 1
VKKVEAIIRPDRLGAVRAAVAEVGYGGLTITQVQGHGKQKGLKEQYRGVEYTIDILSKVKIELVVPDSSVQKIIAAIISAARTGAVGDGKIFIYNVENAVRVRTGEAGDIAL